MRKSKFARRSAQTHIPANRPRPAESLEPRRLLAALSFDAASGVLTVNGTSGSDIIQFQLDETEDADTKATSFTVTDSVTTATAPPKVPTRQQVLDYIDTGTSENTSQSFDIADVREVTVNGLGGDDLIILGRLPISARVDGGDGSDSVSGGVAADTLTGNSGDDYVFGRQGDDVVSGGGTTNADGADEIFGGDGFDTVNYKDRVGNVHVGIGTDADDGESGEGDNVHTDVEGAVGGLGDDTFTAAAGFGGVYFYGNVGDDTLTGANDNDTLIGSEGSDELTGGDGDDLFPAMDLEVDVINGGGGNDTAMIDTGATDDSVTGVENVIGDEVASDPETTSDAAASLDGRNLIVTGGADDDSIRVQPSADGDEIFVIVSNANGTRVSSFSDGDIDTINVAGGAGDDIISLGLVDRPSFLSGGDGDDVIVGGDGDDTIDGGAGSDLLFGRDAADRFLTSDDPDGGDYISGGAGSDVVDYSGRNEGIHAGLGQLPDDGERGEGDNLQTDIEVVLGGSGDDTMDTTSARPVFFSGNAGNDSLTGGNGDDTLVGGPGADVLDGGLGVDTSDDDDADTRISIENVGLG